MNIFLAKLLCETLGQSPNTEFASRKRTSCRVSSETSSGTSEQQSAPLSILNVQLLECKNDFTSKGESGNDVGINTYLYILRREVKEWLADIMPCVKQGNTQRRIRPLRPYGSKRSSEGRRGVGSGLRPRFECECPRLPVKIRMKFKEEAKYELTSPPLFFISSANWFRDVALRAMRATLYPAEAKRRLCHGSQYQQPDMNHTMYLL